MVEIATPEIEKIEPSENKKSSNKTAIFIILAIIIVLAVIVFSFMKTTGNAINMGKNPQVLIKTSEGEIAIELYPDKAPVTVKNFLEYVKSGAYEGTVFHRIIKGFMIQGGGFTLQGQEKPTNAPIKLESDNGLKNLAGTIAMARTNVPDSATNQFFINAVDNDFLDYSPGNPGYAVFGKVISGMDVVKKIEASQTTVKNRMGDWPVKDIIINKIDVIS